MNIRTIIGTGAPLALAASALAGTPQDLFPDGFIDQFNSAEENIFAMLEQAKASAFADNAIQSQDIGLGGERDTSIGIFDDAIESDAVTIWSTNNGRGTFESSASSNRAALGGSGAEASLFLLYRTVADGTADFAPVTDETPRADFSTVALESIVVDVQSVTGVVSLNSFIFTNTVGGGSGALDIDPIIITEPGLVEIPFASFNTTFGTPSLEDVVNISFEFLTEAGGGITLESIAVTGVPAPGAATLATLAGLACVRRRR